MAVAMAEASPQPGRYFCHCCSVEIVPRLPVRRGPGRRAWAPSLGLRRTARMGKRGAAGLGVRRGPPEGRDATCAASCPGN